MSLLYRPLLEMDVEAICEFPQSVDELFYMMPYAVYPLTPEQLWNKARERFCPTVVCDETSGNVLAYANLYDLDAEIGVCWLGNVIVSPLRRGRGAAGFLLQAMMDQARERLGARRLKLYCHNTNTRALLFYTKQGFALNGGYRVIEHPSGNKIVSLEMEKPLDQ